VHSRLEVSIPPSEVQIFYVFLYQKCLAVIVHNNTDHVSAGGEHKRLPSKTLKKYFPKWFNNSVYPTMFCIAVMRKKAQLKSFSTQFSSSFSLNILGTTSSESKYKHRNDTNEFNNQS